MSTSSGMHLAPGFRGLSPAKVPPVLEHDGRVLLQPAAILEYLSQTLGRVGGGVRAQQVRERLLWDAD